MNRVIQELSRQMTSHLDAKPSDVKSTDTQTIQRYKKQLAEVQGELSTEKSLHQITKTSLQALDEDCNRLRQQLHKLRRREKSPATDRWVHNIAFLRKILVAAILINGRIMSIRFSERPRHNPINPRQQEEE